MTVHFAQRPGDHECFDYQRNYVAKVPEGSIVETLSKQSESIPAFIRAIDKSQWEVTHAPYGWSIRTVIEHCCDAERVFGYRFLRFATGDKTDLPGWDENRYASCGYATAVDFDVLAEEFAATRKSHLALIHRVEDAAWDRMGLADGRKMSVRTLVWLMAGHWLHHEEILIQRLGIA